MDILCWQYQYTNVETVLLGNTLIPVLKLNILNKLYCSITYLESFVEKQTKVGEDHPEFLPAVAVLELPK